MSKPPYQVKSLNYCTLSRVTELRAVMCGQNDRRVCSEGSAPVVWVVVSRGHLSGGGDAPNHIQRRSRCTARPRGERRHHPSTSRTRRRAEWTWVARFFAGRVCVRACGLDAKVHGVTATPRTCKPPVRQKTARSDGADYYQTPGSPPPPRRHLKTTSGARRGRLRPASCVSRGGVKGLGSFCPFRRTRMSLCTAKKLRI